MSRNWPTRGVGRDINMAPLCGVVLVLLLFFLVALPSLTRYLRHLPRAADERNLLASLDREGNLWVEKTKLGPVNTGTLTLMRAQVEAAWDTPRFHGAPIILKANDKLSYIQVRPVLEYLHRTMAIPEVRFAIDKHGEDQ
jgi:biopolymer transport protein ExbD